jgi:hypothetical protein
VRVDRVTLSGLLIVLAIGAAACASPNPQFATTAPALPGPSASTVTPPKRSLEVPPTGTASPLGSVSSPIPIDPGLLDLAPATLDGLDRQTDPTVDAGIARDPDLASLASSFATGLYIDPATGNFAYVSIVRLGHPLSDEAYRDYRDSFDEAACRQAGGKTGTASASIGGRQVDIGSCAGGVRTYHAKLADRSIIASISSFGDRRLGEKLVADLRDPAP